MKKLYALFLMMLVFPLVVFASDTAQPDFTLTLLKLIDAIKDKGPIAVILVSVFQLLRTAPVIGILGKFSGVYLQVIISVSTALGFVAVAAAEGKPWGTALVEGLFTSGGAMLIYESIRQIKSKE